MTTYTIHQFKNGKWIKVTGGPYRDKELADRIRRSIKESMPELKLKLVASAPTVDIVPTEA